MRRFGPDHPNTKRKYAQGDIVSSVIRTKKNRTIVLNYDMQLPRPYDNRWMIQGTRGLYNEGNASVYLEGLEGKSPGSETWVPFGPYQEKYEHRLVEGCERGRGGLARRHGRAGTEMVYRGRAEQDADPRLTFTIRC